MSIPTTKATEPGIAPSMLSASAGSFLAEKLQAKSLILIVDDLPIGRETLESLLYAEHYELLFAENGEEALAKAEQYKPDLILLDVMMPGMDGFEACARIRANPLLADIPVLLVTALDDRASRIRGIEVGADDFITKPIDRAEIRARVRTITRLNRYRRMLDERTRFAWVVEQAEDGYLLIGEQDEVLYANVCARRLMGVKPDAELTGQTFLSLVKRNYRCEPELRWMGWPLNLEQHPPEQGGAEQKNGEQKSGDGQERAEERTGQRKSSWQHNINQRDLNQHLNQRGVPAGSRTSNGLYLIRPETASASAAWLQVTILQQPGSVPPVQLVRLHNVTSQMINRRDMFTFHSLVMHKLNTPLHLLLASMELLRTDFDTGTRTAQTTELFELAFTGAHRLRNVVDDILRFLSVPSLSDFANHFKLEALAKLVTQIADNMGLHQVEMRTQITPDKRLVWSERVVEMVLSELLENSRKFHPQQNPQIVIDVQTLPPKEGEKKSSPGWLLLRVSDNGATLTPEHLAQVWSPYYQAERYFTGEVPGMGLGLTIVASLVWELNGRCHMYNRSDGPGVVAELELPLAQSIV